MSHEVQRTTTSVGGGHARADERRAAVEEKDLKVVTRKKPSDAQSSDLLFAWRVAKFVKSNAIVFCAGGATLGIGAGQMSRLDSVRVAALKAKEAKLDLEARWSPLMRSSHSATASTPSPTRARRR